MDGPGEYLPDVTEGVTRVEDLPKAKVAQRSRNYKRRPCPECGQRGYLFNSSSHYGLWTRIGASSAPLTIRA